MITCALKDSKEVEELGPEQKTSCCVTRVDFVGYQVGLSRIVELVDTIRNDNQNESGNADVLQIPDYKEVAEPLLRYL